jgi:predicted permease
MTRLRWLVARLRALTGRVAHERDLDAELQFHLDEDADEARAQGVPPYDAKRAARRRFGNVALTREDARAVWTWGPAERLLQDVRFGLRVLLRQRVFTATALATIVLIVGGTTTVFALVHGVLLRPLPYPDSGRLAMVRADDPEGWTALRHAEVERLREAVPAFEAWGLYRPGYVTTLDRDSDVPLQVQDMRITPDLFPLLGIRVILGRPLVAADEEDANPDVAVIGHDLWQSKFGGAPDVIGKSFELRAGRTVTIVGVAEPGANVPSSRFSMPIVWNPLRVSARDGQSMRFTALARLRPGHSIADARAALAAVPPLPDPRTGLARPVTATRLIDHIAGDNQRMLWVFFGAVGCVLLIGIANLVSLQFVRNTGRARELGVRSALGAGRWRLTRQLLVESLILGTAGGAGGLWLASAAVALLRSALPPTFPRREEVALDGTVWTFAAGLSVIVGVAIGVLPALRAVRPRLVTQLNETTRSATMSRQGSYVQRGLIASETAVALVLLVGAGLLIHSLGRLLNEDAGMQESGLWVARGTLPTRYRSPADLQYWTEALRRTRELPFVERATLVVNDSGPLGGGDIRMSGIVPEGQPAVRGGGLSLSARHVGGDYFSTLGIPIVAGRPILDSDTASGEPVVVLNRAAAAALWPGQPADDAINRQITFGDRPIRVVGLVADFKLTRLDGDVSLQMYAPIGQLPGSAGTSVILLRAKPGAQAVADRATAILRNLEKDLVWVDVASLADVRWKLVATERFRTTVLTVFAGTAVFLALVGIFGLVAYTVTQRTREIGLRVALGATGMGVAALMARHALAPALIGMAAGLAGAVAASQLVASFLFEIQPTDPVTFASAIGLFAAAAVTASLIPALRSGRVNPADVLRHE